jgi:hypothetical protein
MGHRVWNKNVPIADTFLLLEAIFSRWKCSYRQLMFLSSKWNVPIVKKCSYRQFNVPIVKMKCSYRQKMFLSSTGKSTKCSKRQWTKERFCKKRLCSRNPITHSQNVQKRKEASVNHKWLLSVNTKKYLRDEQYQLMWHFQQCSH